MAKNLDELTEQFLRDNDSLYYSRTRNKELEYSYLSHSQRKRRASAEIPVSNLSMKQMQSIPKLCFEDGGTA